MDLLDTLIALDGTLGDGTQPFITRNGNYLSGVPYLWSSAADRAYIFPNDAVAQDLIQQFPQQLQGATIGHFHHT